MSRNYHPKKFLRKAPNFLLLQYFEKQGLLAEIDFTKLPETRIDPIHEAIQQLSDSEKRQIESDFQDIFSLAHEGGNQIFLEEARYQNLSLEESFQNLEGFEAKAFWCFLEHPQIFKEALLFAGRYNLQPRYWRKLGSLPQELPKVDEAVKSTLAQALQSYFTLEEVRGLSCVVDYYDRGEVHYLFAYLEDYSQTNIEWENGQLERRSSKPAFEVIFVYFKEQGVLDVFFEGGKKTVIQLQKIFGQAVLKQDIDPESKKRKAYDLNPLKQRGFSFQYGLESGIKDVRIKSLRFSLPGNVKRLITLEIDSNDHPQGIYDWMEMVFSSSFSNQKIPLPLTNVIWAKISVSFYAETSKGQTTKTFEISSPDKCSLKNEGKDLVIRQMLLDSGLELSHEPQAISQAV